MSQWAVGESICVHFTVFISSQAKITFLITITRPYGIGKIPYETITYSITAKSLTNRTFIKHMYER